MLGEITHLQGIIDDLVVLTAEPHKLPPASEQVRPALESRPKTRRTWEDTILPLCGEALGGRKPDSIQKLLLWGFWEHLPWYRRKCSGPSGAQTDTDGQKPGPPGLGPSKQNQTHPTQKRTHGTGQPL